MRMMEMDASERPREKLLARGAEALSDGELLAILLRTGRKGESALDLARRILSLAGGSFSGLFGCDPLYLCSLPGLGPSRATALLAAFEIGRRFMQEEACAEEQITSASQIYAFMRPRLKALGHEECWEVLLDIKNKIIKVLKVTKGGGKSTIFDIPAIIRNALDSKASAIIVIHNHPTGDPRPSRQDIRETASLRDACSACSLSLLDHIIIADEHFYSFDEEKVY